MSAERCCCRAALRLRQTRRAEVAPWQCQSQRCHCMGAAAPEKKRGRHGQLLKWTCTAPRCGNVSHNRDHVWYFTAQVFCTPTTCSAGRRLRQRAVCLGMSREAPTDCAHVCAPQGRPQPRQAPLTVRQGWEAAGPQPGFSSTVLGKSPQLSSHPCMASRPGRQRAAHLRWLRTSQTAGRAHPRGTDHADPEPPTLQLITKEPPAAAG